MSLFLRSLAATAVVAFETLICLSSVLALAALAAGPLYQQRLPFAVEPWMWAAAFSAACALGVGASWVKGVFDKRLPARIGGEPRHAHISGWTFVWIVLVTAGIVAIGQWAAASAAHRQIVNDDWGVTVLAFLLAAFVLAALAPGWNLGERAAPAIIAISGFVRPLGRVLSFVDGFLVFAVAGAAGATQTNLIVRYVALFGALGACAVAGYWLEPPWGLVPLAWGAMFAVAISRRWAWVEVDRELAMLNRRFVGPHLRIGFAQDLRDEALLSFAALFILVPLAFRQAQLAALAAHADLFAVGPHEAAQLRTWLAFFGAQLAKAVPFVDWAGVYGVGSSDDNIIQSVPSRHIEFAIRALVDFVLLGALLQALAISARNAAQRGLFYEGQLDRLDPFIEPVEFRKLLHRTADGLAPDPEKIKDFPRYDPIRLSEFAGAERNKLLRGVANALRIHQGAAKNEDFHKELVERATTHPRDKLAIIEVLHAIRNTGPERSVAELDQARRALNKARNLIDARLLNMELLLEAPNSAAKAEALEVALAEERDSSSAVRLAALRGLIEAASQGDHDAMAVLRRVAASQISEARPARAAVKRLEREGASAPPPAPAPSAPAREPPQAAIAANEEAATPVAPPAPAQSAPAQPVQTPAAQTQTPPAPSVAVAEVPPSVSADNDTPAPRKKSGAASLGIAAAAIAVIVALMAFQIFQPRNAPEPSAPEADATPTRPSEASRSAPAPALPPVPVEAPAAPSPTATASEAQNATRCPGAPITAATSVTVRPGDTLSAIARECYGAEEAWRVLAQCNPFLNERNLSDVSPLHGGDLLYVGDQVVVPQGGVCP